MNWIKANKFLTGFFAVMLVGIGVLGYFLIAASSAFDAADDNYHDKASELNRLRHLPLYPNATNLKALEDQKQEAAKLVAQFQANLATKEFPADEMTPQEFQDKLKGAVTDIVAKAAEAHMELPKEGKFYLGFDPYESRPPEKEAVEPLSRQLKAIQWVVERLIDKKITKLTTLTRIPLPEENIQAGGNNNRRQERQGRLERSERELVSKFPFDLELVGRQTSIAEVLDVIVSASAPQFYIPRVVRIKNQKDKGPERATAAAATAAAATAATGTAAAGQPAAPLGYIVGEELLEASLRLEIVEFAPPKADTAPKPKASK